jgi:hypothetical protein
MYFKKAVSQRVKYCTTPSPARGMITRRGPVIPAPEKTKTSKTSRATQPPRTSQAAQVLTNMADTTYKVIGLSKKKGKPAEISNADYQIQYSPRGEKEKHPYKPKSDDYYDDRLSRDSQLDSHLKELVSDGQDNGEMGGLVVGAYVEQETDNQGADEFYDEAEKDSEVVDQPADINLAGDIYTPAATEEMLGDWGTDETLPPKADQPRQATLACQNASSVSSELLINISDRYEEERIHKQKGGGHLSR